MHEAEWCRKKNEGCASRVHASPTGTEMLGVQLVSARRILPACAVGPTVQLGTGLAVPLDVNFCW